MSWLECRERVRAVGKTPFLPTDIHMEREWYIEVKIEVQNTENNLKKKSVKSEMKENRK